MDFYGVISEQTSEHDFIVGADQDIPKAKKSYSGIQYNQKDVSSVSCTIHGAIGAVSDLTGYTYSLEERKALWDEAIALGASSIGWYINKAVDLVKKRAKFDLQYHRVTLGSRPFFDALDKGYTIVVGYSGNTEYNMDRNDGVLDQVSFGDSTYAHCVRMTKSGRDYELIVDNYDYRKSNTYKINKDNITELVSNGVFFKSGYFYVNQGTMEQLPEWGEEAWAWAKKEGLLSDESEFTDQLTKGELIVFLKRYDDYISI